MLKECTTEYLRHLYIELLRALARPFLSLTDQADNLGEAEYEDQLKMITYEIQRLLNHPLLFPSEAARVKFLALLALDSKLQFEEAISGLLIEAEIQELDDVRRQDYSRPSYLPGTHGWENFLLNMAPGGPEDPSNRATTTPKSSFQMIPPVGMRIIGEFEREEREIVRFIEQYPGAYGVAPARSTLMIDFDKPTPWEERIPRRGLKQHAAHHIARPNPFKEERSIRDDISKHRICELEKLGDFLHDIDSQDARVLLSSANAFPVTTIRKWGEHTKYSKLRFNQSDSSAA